MNNVSTESQHVPAPPRGIAVSGIIFSTLYISTLVLIRLAIPADPSDPGVWLADPDSRNWVREALNLVPFTGIAFLWFMAVLRNRIGRLEDKFFATVFLGHVEVEQDEIRARDVCVTMAAVQKPHGLFAIFDQMDVDRDSGVLQRDLSQSGIAGTVFDEQQFDWSTE